MSPERPASEFRIEPYDRARHGDGPARVVETVFREHGFTWEPDGYHTDVRFPERAYAPPDHFFAVALVGDEVVGTVGGERRGTTAELKRLYLLEAQRGGGLGRALLDHFLVWARGHGCRRAILWSDKRFTHAHHLYPKAGFRVIGDRVSDDPDVSPEWGYARDLY